jgi:hypothetical protein
MEEDARSLRAWKAREQEGVWVKELSVCALGLGVGWVLGDGDVMAEEDLAAARSPEFAASDVLGGASRERPDSTFNNPTVQQNSRLHN